MKHEHGFVLIIVLWLLVLMSALAVTAGGIARTETRISATLTERAHLIYAAQAGIFETVSELITQQNRDLSDLPRTPVDYWGIKVKVQIRDECSKIDLNTGHAQLIRGLVKTLSIESNPAALADAILDWRDPDQRRRPLGAEDADYRAAGLRHDSRDGVFETIDELGLVFGMSRTALEQLMPEVTVDCLNAGVDPLHASQAVLSSIPNLDAKSIDDFLEQKSRFLAEPKQVRYPVLAGGDGFTQPSHGQTFEIRATAEGAATQRVTWQAVVWITQNPENPYVLRQWQQIFTSTPLGQ